MARSSNVPKFGEWEKEGNVPYTLYFEKARKTRGTEKMAHGDPKDQAQTLSNNSSRPRTDMVRPSKPGVGPEAPPGPAYDQRQGRARSTGVGPRPEAEAQGNWDASRSNHESRHAREDGPQRRSNDTRLQGEAVGHGKARRRVGVGSEHSVEGSALHRNQQARGGAGGNGGSSHSSEGKNLYQGSSAGHGFAPLTPGRTRPKPVSYTSDDLDYGSAVPKFGGWNEGNPDSGENYTEKFNKVLKDRQNGAVVAPSPPGYRRQVGKESPKKKCGCFPWS